MTEEYLFVYGTLRQHHSQHALLQQNCVYINEGRLTGKLYQIRDYPGVILSDDRRFQVVGEVYRIQNHEMLFAALDDYEECSTSFPEPHEYTRQQHKVNLADGGQILAWVYIYNHSIAGLKLITSGDFLNR